MDKENLKFSFISFEGSLYEAKASLKTKEEEKGGHIWLSLNIQLICKKWQVDRTELNMDQAWAETGDRYMLKLFRDYIFHQVKTQNLIVQPSI